MIIFFGDSITRDWPIGDVTDEAGPNAGIGGDTTGQMLLRFERDVLARRPEAVHILGGINDIAENQGPVPLGVVASNLGTMVEAARRAGIGVAIGLLLPCARFVKRPAITPRPAVRQLNAAICSLAVDGAVVVADYFTPLAGADERLADAFTADGLHPNAAGYAVMSPVARDALARLRSAAGQATPTQGR